MMFFVLIGIIFIRYMYSQVVVSPEVKEIWDRAVEEYKREQRHPNMFVYNDATEPDLDLIYNNVIDFEEAFR